MIGFLAIIGQFFSVAQCFGNFVLSCQIIYEICGQTKPCTPRRFQLIQQFSQLRPGGSRCQTLDRGPSTVDLVCGKLVA